MNIYTAFSLFSLIILLYWVITELFTIFFRFTGLPDERARFQVISNCFEPLDKLMLPLSRFGCDGFAEAVAVAASLIEHELMFDARFG